MNGTYIYIYTNNIYLLLLGGGSRHSPSSMATSSMAMSPSMPEPRMPSITIWEREKIQYMESLQWNISVFVNWTLLCTTLHSTHHVIKFLCGYWIKTCGFHYTDFLNCPRQCGLNVYSVEAQARSSSHNKWFASLPSNGLSDCFTLGYHTRLQTLKKEPPLFFFFLRKRKKENDYGRGDAFVC